MPPASKTKESKPRRGEHPEKDITRSSSGWPSGYGGKEEEKEKEGGKGGRGDERRELELKTWDLDGLGCRVRGRLWVPTPNFPLCLAPSRAALFACPSQIEDKTEDLLFFPLSPRGFSLRASFFVLARYSYLPCPA